MTRRSPKRGGAIGRPYVDPGAMPPDDLDRPVFVFDRRLHKIERAFYRHVLRVIDLDALFNLEQQLWSLLGDHGPLTDDQVLDLSSVIIERALERVGRDPIRAMRPGVSAPGGHMIPSPEEPHEHCPFCDGEPEDGEAEDGEGGSDDDDGGPDDGGAGSGGTEPRIPPAAGAR